MLLRAIFLLLLIQSTLIVRAQNTFSFSDNQFTIGDKKTIQPFIHNLCTKTLTKEDYPELDSLKLSLDNFPNLKIEIAVHTSSRGSKPYNSTLSSKMAISYKEYIHDIGGDTSRIVAVGYGESRLINNCKDLFRIFGKRFADAPLCCCFLTGEETL